MSTSPTAPTQDPLPPRDEPGWTGWAPVAIAIAIVGAALAILVWLGQDMTFYHDECAFILQRDLSLDGLLKPHNEHLSVTLVALYRVLVGTVGTVSYWPYLAVTFLLHVMVAGIVFVVVRREASLAWAFGALALVLLLGSGGDDILWAFQSGTIGAVAAGMAAVVIAPRRPAVAAILLTIALVTSGAGLAFVAGTGLHLLLTRPRALPWLFLPAAVYVAWFLAYGRVGRSRDPQSSGACAEYVLTRAGRERRRCDRLDLPGRRTGRPPGARVRLRLAAVDPAGRPVAARVRRRLLHDRRAWRARSSGRSRPPPLATSTSWLRRSSSPGSSCCLACRRPAGSVLGAVVLAVASSGTCSSWSRHTTGSSRSSCASRP